MQSNLPARSMRVSESALVWVEMLSGATGTLELPKYATFRVRATGATTVTIDSTLAATMSSAEIMLFNAGAGNPDDNKQTVTVVIAAASAFVQVGKTVEQRPASL